jgi:hypothetical protein
MKKSEVENLFKVKKKIFYSVVRRCPVVLVSSCKVANCQSVELSWRRVVKVESCFNGELKGEEL